MSKSNEKVALITGGSRGTSVGEHVVVPGLVPYSATKERPAHPCTLPASTPSKA